jgi:MOSC domain-containing protein YiiM
VLLVSVQIGVPRTYRGADGRAWRSGFGKQRVDGEVRVRRENLEGDGQADRKHHGGPDMAVLAYPHEHYARWIAELRWPELPHGGFGENFTVAGVTERTACLGDVWRVGTALLQIAQPRKPCRNISRYWHRPELLRLVVQSGRYGFYLRVLEEGAVRAGDEIQLVDRPHSEWTVHRATAARLGARRDPAEARDLLHVAALGDDWRQNVSRELVNCGG